MDELSKKRILYSNMFIGIAAYFFIVAMLFSKEKCAPLSFIDMVVAVSMLLVGIIARKSTYFINLFAMGGIAVAIHVITHQFLLGPIYGYQYMYISWVSVIFFIAYVKKLSHKKSILYVLCILGLFILSMICESLIKYPIYRISIFTHNVVVIVNIIISFMISVLFNVLLVAQATNDTGFLKNQNTDLEESANVDTLTGLLNRRSVDSYLNLAFSRARGLGEDFTLFMCDIDNFKRVNDTYGHDCGDEVLKNIASIIKKELRPNDLVFRWGGEEILILINSGYYSATNIAERCRKSIEDSEVDYKGTKVKVTITIGGASYYQGATKDVLIKRADNNLYNGKNNGKNQVVM